MSSDAVTGEVKAAQGLVPNLRFPEFWDAGEWELKPLLSMAKRKTRRNADQEITRVLTNSAEHGVVDQKDYFEKDIAVQGNLDSYFVVEEGDYVYNPRVSSLAPVGPIGKNKVGTGVMSPLYTVFSFEGAHDRFYEHFFRSALWHDYMRSASNSGARHDRMAISNDDFMAMPVPAPCAGEQQKVADCLSSLDEVIAAEGERLAALRNYRSGLIQGHFPAQGQTTPRLRFPEFQDAGDWEWTKLGAVLETITPPKKLLTAEYQANGKYPIVDQGQEPVAGWTDDAGALVSNGLPVIVFGDHTCVLKLIDFPFAQGADGIKILKPNGKMSVQFLYCALRVAPLSSDKYKRHFSDLKENSVAHPDIETGEQRAISECIASLDNMIVATEDKIDAFKAHKSGLMQQLFPSPVQRGA